MKAIEEEYDEMSNHSLHLMNVTNPEYYAGNDFQVIDIIEDFNLGFNLGNSIKYILRAGKKGDRVEDLKKAVWYLERECNSRR